MLWKHESPTSSKLLRVSAMTPSRLNDSLIRRSILSVAFCLLFLHSTSFGIGRERYVETVAHTGSFPVAERGVAASIYVDAGDYAGVVRAARDLKSDIDRATGDTSTIKFAQSGLGKHVIIVGTIGKSPIIDRLIKNRKIDVSEISGKWESFYSGRVETFVRRGERAGDCRQRQTRNDLRNLRSLRANRSLALVLVGRCSSPTQRRALRKAR